MRSRGQFLLLLFCKTPSNNERIQYIRKVCRCFINYANGKRTNAICTHYFRKNREMISQSLHTCYKTPYTTLREKDINPYILRTVAFRHREGIS